MKKLKSYFSTDSLRIQLLARSLLILAVLLALVGALQYLYMRDVVFNNKADALRSQVRTLPPPVLNSPDFVLEPDDRMGPKRFFSPEASLVFIDENGNYTVIAKRPDDADIPKIDVQEYLGALKTESGKNNHKENNYLIREVNGVEQLIVLQPVRFESGEIKGLVQISTPTGPLKDLLIGQLMAFLALSLIAMLFGLLAFLPVLKRTLVPLNNMVDTAGQIDAGNLDKRFPVNQGQVEIDRLAESCNGMLDRLESSFAAERETKEQMRRFIADASHELRTPLTSIHGFLEILLRGAKNQPEQLDKALKSMYSESQRLSKLVHDLLLLTKMDRVPNIELKEGSLAAVIRDMEAQLRILAGSRGLTLDLDDGEAGCQFDTEQMKQVVLNLFHNAVQHTDPEKGHIRISLHRLDNGTQLSVEDNGPGIRPEHLPRVFDRFYRSDTSRTRKYGGAGLGLSISKSIVEAHGGTINVDSEPGRGSVFRVWIPC